MTILLHLASIEIKKMKKSVLFQPLPLQWHWQQQQHGL
jgi:hypothetical protein